jgi:hypothetical protein
MSYLTQPITPVKSIYLCPLPPACLPGQTLNISLSLTSSKIKPQTSLFPCPLSVCSKTVGYISVHGVRTYLHLIDPFMFSKWLLDHIAGKARIPVLRQDRPLHPGPKITE